MQSVIDRVIVDCAQSLQELDTTIDCLHTKFEKQWSDVSHVASTLAAVPQLLTSVQQLMEQIGQFIQCTEGNYGRFVELFFCSWVNHV
jgi:hypothetical protein